MHHCRQNIHFFIDVHIQSYMLHHDHVHHDIMIMIITIITITSTIMIMSIRDNRAQPDNREGNESCLAVLNNFYNDGVRSV